MCTLRRPADSRQRLPSANRRPALVRRSPDSARFIISDPVRLRAVPKRLYGAGVAPGRLLLLIFGLLIFTFAGLPTHAQDSSMAKLAEAGADDKAEERAYALLDDVIVRVQNLKLPENRIRFQTAAACLLWPRDESRARAIILENMNALASLIAGADKADPHFAERAQAYTTLRYELVHMIASRDAKLALNFLRGTRQERPAVRRPPAPDQEVALELTLAAEVASGDAKEATRIAEESLSNGVAAELLNVLGKLSTSDREAATGLATDIIKRLQTEDLTSGGSATVVAVGLLSMTRASRGPARDAADRAEPDAPGGRAAITVDEQARRDLISAVAAAAALMPAGRMANAHLLFNSLAAVMPEVEKYATGQLAAVRAKSEEFRRSLDPSTRAWQKYDGLRQEGSPDALLEAAAKAPPEVGDELYAAAAFKVLDGDDPERARQILNSISDPQRRALKSRMLEQQLLERSLLRGKLEDAEQRIPPDATTKERFSTLLYLSTLAAQKTETALARRFISEAAGLVAGRVRSGFQFTARLRLALSANEPKQSFAILEDLSDQLNDLLTAAETVDGFGPDCFSEGELKPFAGNLWGELVGQFGDALAALASKDSERAVSIARKLQRDEACVSVSLRVAERVLADAEAKRRGTASAGTR